MATWCDRCKENNDRYLDDIYFYEIEEEEEESRGGYRTHHLCQWCWEKFLFWLLQQPKNETLQEKVNKVIQEGQAAQDRGDEEGLRLSLAQVEEMYRHAGFIRDDPKPVAEGPENK